MKNMDRPELHNPDNPDTDPKSKRGFYPDHNKNYIWNSGGAIQREETV